MLSCPVEAADTYSKIMTYNKAHILLLFKVDYVVKNYRKWPNRRRLPNKRLLSNKRPLYAVKIV